MKDFVAVAVAASLLTLAGLLSTAFVIMIVVGLWHGHNPSVPALGYVDCMYAASLTGLLTLFAAPVARA